MERPDVAALVAGAAGGDRAAWDELVARYAGMVHSISRAHGLHGADAADVNQVVWLRLVEHLDRIREPAAVGGWLATTARNECLRVLRARRRTTPWDEDASEPAADVVTDVPSPEAVVIASEDEAAVWRAFERLSPRCRALLRLMVADPRPSYEEIAAALGWPIGSIGPRRGRCVEELRRLL